MAAKRALGKLALALVAGLAPAFLLPQVAPASIRQLQTQATLAKGWPQSVKKPRAQLRAWHVPRSVASCRDVIVSFAGLVVSVTGLVISQRQLRLAWRESSEGRLRQAEARMLQPFEPERAQKDVADRQVIEVIRERLRGWSEHATIIAGRYGSGKTVALEEALRGAKGVLVRSVRGKEWEDALYKVLGLDDFGMLKVLLARVCDQLQKSEQNITSVPVIVLDIPRTTTEGMDTISSFAKYLSSDGSHAHVIVCASSAAMATTFDAGGPRQRDIYVDDLTREEAEKLLGLWGHDNWQEFTAACGFNAVDLVRACQTCDGPESLKIQKANMQMTAFVEVTRFRNCNIDGDKAGCNILTSLVDNRKNWDGQGVDELSAGGVASPRKVTQWIRDENVHPVIWHMPDKRYRFSSEFHAEAAAKILGAAP